MALISDNYHKKKLKDLNINIKTKYIVGNKILERNTDDSSNDDIKSGIRCEKDYYVNNKLCHTEKIFDSRIEYTFISKEEENMDYKCPNCGMRSKLKNFLEGCPYCKTYYNVDYTDKDLGTKYHYDRVLRNTKYRVITAIIDLIVSLIISFIVIKTTSRTFNSYDISKIIIYGLIVALILYYVFYSLDAYVILGPIKKYKDKQNQKQREFWSRTNLDKKEFFNNLNYEVRKKYYKMPNVIDYDVLDFIEFNDYTKDDKLYVKVIAEVRVVYYEKGKITSKFINEEYTMKKVTDDTLELKDGANIIKCHNCGASINAETGKCEHCHSEIKYLQKWVLV